MAERSGQGAPDGGDFNVKGAEGERGVARSSREQKRCQVVLAVLPPAHMRARERGERWGKGERRKEERGVRTRSTDARLFSSFALRPLSLCVSMRPWTERMLSTLPAVALREPALA